MCSSSCPSSWVHGLYSFSWYGSVGAGQLNTKSPFEYVDMSVKEAYDEEWKKKVRTRIRRSDGVLVIVTKNSLKSTGQKWEIACAAEEKKPVKGIWGYKDDQTKLEGVSIMTWTWPNIADWIDSL
ncbi:TIR domain-containing protein [Xanthomonas campestris]|uniref:TIR domain-containing protein n=3 Tax=Xanthomonas campestris TaxID=339 RepID=UPI001ED8E124|nr:TIR domain-containing protein [Xanthomonas campestris]